LCVNLIERKTGNLVAASIALISRQELAEISKDKRFSLFDWRKEGHKEVYKLQLRSSGMIIGLMSVTDHPEELWLEIDLLESSDENVGSRKEFQNIGGCLIAYACRLAFSRGYNGFVALRPKTVLKIYYHEKYGFKPAGLYLYSDVQNSLKLINAYLE